MKNMVIRRNPEYAEKAIKEYTSKGWRLMSNQRCQEIRGGHIYTFCELTFEGDDSLITEEEQREKDYYEEQRKLREEHEKQQKEREQRRKENLEREIRERPENFKKGVKFLIVGSSLAFVGIILLIIFWLTIKNVKASAEELQETYDFLILELKLSPLLLDVAGLPFIIIGIVKMKNNRKNR